MAWAAIYRLSDHSLYSIGSVIANVGPLAAAGLAAKGLPAQPDLTQVQWDPVTLAFIPIPPPPAPVDRVEDFRAGVTDWMNIDSVTRTEISAELAMILGERRYRRPDEAVNL